MLPKGRVVGGWEKNVFIKKIIADTHCHPYKQQFWSRAFPLPSEGTMRRKGSSRRECAHGPARQTRVVKRTGREVWESRPIAAVPARTVPRTHEGPSLEICAGNLSSFLSGNKKKKKNSYLYEECIAFYMQLPKTQLWAKSIWQNPLAALIQFLKEISCWKVTEKPSSCAPRLGDSKLSLLRGSPCLMPLPSVLSNQWINK